MEFFAEYLALIDNAQNRERMAEVLNWVSEKFPNLKPRIAWNHPMFTEHGTFIIGFSAAKHHMAVAPERAGIIRFSDEIKEAGYEHSKELVRIPWDKPFNFSLLEKLIRFNIVEKAETSTFWRKSDGEIK
ncbi:MAG: iron chaperone [Dehalobacterium sp.]